MLRPLIVFAFVAIPNMPYLCADEPAEKLVVAADERVAALMPRGLRAEDVAVLIKAADEPFDRINARAMKLRYATHFVYESGSESNISAIFRERLANHGAILIDLRVVNQRSRIQGVVMGRSFAFDTSRVISRR